MPEKTVGPDGLALGFPVCLLKNNGLYFDGMVERLTVIFFIILCLLLGLNLTILPWISVGGIGDWGDNYLLVFLTERSGLPVIQHTVASTWFRGAVTGLGLLNILIAFWEIAHFNKSVAMLQSSRPDEKS